METEIKIYTVRFNSKTAGLSPVNNERIEIFFSGCKMAREGNPCLGCFNQELWQGDFYFSETATHICDEIERTTDNKYVTIVGGEPMDQPVGLEELVWELKYRRFHIVLITHYLKDEVPLAILRNINILIDGKYDASQRIFSTDTRPGVNNVIGSKNQKIYCNEYGNGFMTDISDVKDLRKYYCNGYRVEVKK